MGASWSFSGLDTNRLIADIEAYVPVYLDELAGEMAELGMELVARMHEMILAAHTATGEARVASWPGLQAGRYETGRMYDAVDFEISADADSVTLGWGWTDEFRDYFLYQDYGTTQIAAVGSLGDSFTLGITRMASLMDRMALG